MENCKPISTPSDVNHKLSLSDYDEELVGGPYQEAVGSLLYLAQGVIYCNDLRGLQEDYILSELDTQNVIEVKKILKKSDYELIETGLIILTFETTNLPSEIRIGYEKVNVWPYIPLPLKCNNCLRYGHTAKICKAERTCANCASNYHLNDDMEEKCKNEEACINCIRQLQQPTNHIATDKKCPIFLKQKEIQAIKTTLKKDYKGALAIYNERHQHNQQPYSTIVRNNPNT
ncbi:PREDICTED: uncharacterized protein LOC108358628, partial [Rhagoletis zephyria]|uniref:uncharacterized protein LOC108358628 n=1 Tax=Rhagoletis zephyria TaxID=28612 RepID=UPI00081186AD